MERAALPRRPTWQVGKVVQVATETAQISSISLDLPHWSGHRPGQHVDVRLTAEDGYQAQRSYSIASATEDEHLVLTVHQETIIYRSMIITITRRLARNPRPGR